MHIVHSPKHHSTKKVLVSFACGIAGAAFIVIIAALSAQHINIHHRLSERWINVFLCMGFIFDAGALYGQRGWDIQTWKGESHPERLNWFLFRLFASLGLFFTTWGCLLKP